MTKAAEKTYPWDRAYPYSPYKGVPFPGDRLTDAFNAI